MPKKKEITYPFVLSSRYGRVKIYKVSNRVQWSVYTVVWSVGKVRNRKSFSDELLAHNHAESVLKQFETGQAIAGRATSSDYLLLESCKAKLGNVPLMEAVNYYLQMHGGCDSYSKPVSEVIELFLKDIEAQGNSQQDVYGSRCHLQQFSKVVSKPIGLIKTSDVDKFLQEKECTNRTRVNMRTSIVRLFGWAKAKGHLPKGVETAAEGASTYKAEQAKSPGVFTPEQMAKILETAKDEWVPYLAIGAFAGIRAAEIQRLNWSDINMEEKVIILGADVTKTNRRRVAHMPDNLVKWLQSYEGAKEGLVSPPKPNRETSRIAKALKTPWVDNGLRHSYISYQMALLRNADAVAEQCGNSAKQVQASYKANAVESEAKRWFAIEPA